MSAMVEVAAAWLSSVSFSPPRNDGIDNVRACGFLRSLEKFPVGANT
jgi:hypothetical protein